METFVLLSASIFPAIVYFSLGLYLVLKGRRCGGGGDGAAFLIRKDYTVFLFILALCFLSGSPAALCGDSPELGFVTERILLKIYLASSVLPYIVLRRCVFQDRPWIQFYASAALVAVLVILLDVISYSGSSAPLYGMLCGGAVVVNLLIYIYVLYFVCHWPAGTGKEHRALARELQIHAVLLSVYNFIFLFYSFGAHVTVGYFLAAAGFAAVHAAIAVAAADSRTLESCMPRSAYSDMAPDGGGIPDMGVFSAGEHFQEKDPDMANDSTLSLKERLLGYFESEKPYLSKNLTMEEVAMRLFTNKTYLSKTINVEMNKNFRELVNYFRVKEAINIFSTNPDISMGELRDRCGFNNNASFTSAFKLNTGYTPGEWCRDVKSGRVKAINK